ncbi:NAD(P)/FAD-dependent oxidoreductase [Nocardia shimofusensis]|uniref:NAD(P)/FAD-dependent oxidoreductase n=1 Tax=Nocardia shimofusensis TaxID=228596 RepID=UPI0008324740|nr:FAD-dependent oxidoreductase [Nocardia shimofusensis]
MGRDQTLVVVGAGLAGIRACESARRASHEGPIVLVGDEPHLPYDRPPLSKAMLVAPDDAQVDVQLRPASVLEDELGVRVLTSTTALALDTERRNLHTTGGDLGYDELIIASGATARRLPEDRKYSGILALRTLDDARRVRKALSNRARVVVIGAGFIGSEIASAARKLGAAVTIVESAPAPLIRSLGTQIGALCADLHRDHGTDLRLDTTITAIHPRDDAEPDADGRYPVGAVELSDGTTLHADVVVAGIGASPSTAWLKNSGVQLHHRDGGVMCDEHLAAVDETGAAIAHVWAAGDVAHWPNPLFDRTMRLEHWTSAADQGALAARNALAAPEDRRPYSTVPYFWSDWYETRIQFVGVPQAEEVLVQHRRDERGGTVALYRAGQRLIGVLTIGRPDLIMKYRRLVAGSATFQEGVDFGAAS